MIKAVQGCPRLKLRYAAGAWHSAHMPESDNYLAYIVHAEGLAGCVVAMPVPYALHAGPRGGAARAGCAVTRLIVRADAGCAVVAALSGDAVVAAAANPADTTSGIAKQALLQQGRGRGEKVTCCCRRKIDESVLDSLCYL